MKRTERSWVALPNGDIVARPPSGRGSGIVIARLFPTSAGPLGEREREANSRLIAAAPELLAALDDLSLACVAGLVGNDSREQVRARAAIAKARGAS
jgi:hypothetical protein